MARTASRSRHPSTQGPREGRGDLLGGLLGPSTNLLAPEIGLIIPLERALCVWMLRLPLRAWFKLEDGMVFGPTELGVRECVRSQEARGG